MINSERETYCYDTRMDISLEEKQTAIKWIEDNRKMLSDFHLKIWNYAEPSLREYKSARAYVELLRDKGFNVDEGTGGMPTAFLATYGEGKPVLASFAEYDAVPANNQAAVPYKKLRSDNLHPYAAGHTDPHSALGVTTLAAILGTKAAMEEHGLKGTLKYLGEPAEKICISKPYHAAKGYYDDLDACILYHPGTVNRVVWETQCGSYWNIAFTFEAFEPEKWKSPLTRVGWYRGNPGALDALCLMYTTTKYTKEAIHPRTAGWTITEFITIGGQSTTNPPLISEIDYAFRAPTLKMQEKTHEFLRRNARLVAETCGCKVTERIVTKTRVGLFNRTMAELLDRNFRLIGPPIYNEKAKEFGRQVQSNLGLEPMVDPFTDDCQRLLTPEEGEDMLRKVLPEWVEHYSSDDYVEYMWHAPSARLYTAKAVLRPSKGFNYPNWARLAMTGEKSTINPAIFIGGKTIATSLVELLMNPKELKKAQKEFNDCTGGGVGGAKWIAPLLPSNLDPPINMRWPEYIKTERGEEWWIPTQRK
jgi:aminobenzoyl-glutamate utilization protein B